jgi:hypothetical protein
MEVFVVNVSNECAAKVGRSPALPHDTLMDRRFGLTDAGFG